MRRIKTLNLVLSAFFIALGLVLPFLTGQIPAMGSRLLPMHIPVLLCGFACGGVPGLLVGFIVPLFRSLLFGLPPMFPIALAMAFELAAYGLTAGLLYRLLPKRAVSVYISLIVSMIVGRAVWGGASWILYSLSGSAFTWKIFMAGAFINAVPGIIVQLILIPIIVMALQRARLINHDRT